MSPKPLTPQQKVVYVAFAQALNKMSCHYVTPVTVGALLGVADDAAHALATAGLAITARDVRAACGLTDDAIKAKRKAFNFGR